MTARGPLAIHISAWVVAFGAVAAVAVRYDALPDMLPVTRFSDAPKSLLLALRVPLINVLTLGLIEVLARGLGRSALPAATDRVSTCLRATAAGKVGIEAAGILLLPRPINWTVFPLVVFIAVGLGAAVFAGRDLLSAQCWRKAKLSRSQQVVAGLLAAGIALLNLPLIVR